MARESTSIRLEVELRKRAQRVLFERGESLSDALEWGLQKWLQEFGEDPINKATAPSTDSTVGKYTSTRAPELQEWAELLFGILESGHLIARDAVLQNLWAFRLLVARDRKGITRGKKIPVPSPAHFADRTSNIAEALTIAQRVTDESSNREGIDGRTADERNNGGAGESDGETDNG